MVKPVDRIIPDFAQGRRHVHHRFIPRPASTSIARIGLIRENGCRPGWCSIRPRRLNCLDHMLEKLDLVLLMSVNPGFGGQQFIPRGARQGRARCAS